LFFRRVFAWHLRLRCAQAAGGAPRAVSTQRLARVRDAAERVARGYGLEIFDVQLRRESYGTVLRVIIDRPAPGAPTAPAAASAAVSGGTPAGAAGAARTPGDDSIGIADCQRVSQDLSALLDVEEDDLEASALGQAYTLEVSSPGLDRPLRHEADYRRFSGRLAKLVTTVPVNGQSAFAGRLGGVEEGMVLLEEGRKVHRVPVAQIKRGRLEVEF
jgi:ribosome maturation factor RimP